MDDYPLLGGGWQLEWASGYIQARYGSAAQATVQAYAQPQPWTYSYTTTTTAMSAAASFYTLDAGPERVTPEGITYKIVPLYG